MEKIQLNDKDLANSLMCLCICIYDWKKEKRKAVKKGDSIKAEKLEEAIQSLNETTLKLQSIFFTKEAQ